MEGSPPDENVAVTRQIDLGLPRGSARRCCCPTALYDHNAETCSAGCDINGPGARYGGNASLTVTTNDRDGACDGYLCGAGPNAAPFDSDGASAREGNPPLACGSRRTCNRYRPAAADSGAASASARRGDIRRATGRDRGIAGPRAFAGGHHIPTAGDSGRPVTRSDAKSRDGTSARNLCLASVGRRAGGDDIAAAGDDDLPLASRRGDTFDRDAAAPAECDLRRAGACSCAGNMATTSNGHRPGASGFRRYRDRAATRQSGGARARRRGRRHGIAIAGHDDSRGPDRLALCGAVAGTRDGCDAKARRRASRIDSASARDIDRRRARRGAGDGRVSCPGYSRAAVVSAGAICCSGASARNRSLAGMSAGAGRDNGSGG